MKKKSRIIIAAVFIIAIIGIAAFTINNNQEYFTGSRVKNPDYYTLEFSRMNQTDTHSIYLEEDDAFDVVFDIQKGKVDLIIGIEGKEPIYTGNSLKSGRFQVEAEEAGDYKITVKAKNAKGAISVKYVA